MSSNFVVVMINPFSSFRLPRKRTSAHALFLNHKDEILIVKPTYLNHWLTPGGLVEHDESPIEACIREVKEELGLDVPGIKQLLGVEYNPNLGRGGDGLAFVFYGGRLSETDIEKIVLQESELCDFKFVPSHDLSLLNTKLQKRVARCMEGVQRSAVVYLEAGVMIG